MALYRSLALLPPYKIKTYLFVTVYKSVALVPPYKIKTYLFVTVYKSVALVPPYKIKTYLFVTVYKSVALRVLNDNTRTKKSLLPALTTVVRFATAVHTSL